MFLRKALAGSAATHTWPHDGAVVEVPDHVAAELLLIPDGGFTEVRAADDLTVAPPDVVANAGLIRLAVAAEMGTVREELAGELHSLRMQLAEVVEARIRDLRRQLNLTPVGTAAPAGVGASGGSAEPSGIGPAGADPPDAAPNPPGSAVKRPAGRGR